MLKPNVENHIDWDVKTNVENHIDWDVKTIVENDIDTFLKSISRPNTRRNQYNPSKRSIRPISVMRKNRYGS